MTGLTLQQVVLGIYVLCLVPLAALGLHRIHLLRLRARARVVPVPDDPVEWPSVTVQVPLYNERAVAERVIDAVAALDYPAVQIQVLDDSTDDTAERVDRAVAKHRALGVDIAVLRRTDRAGFKAGALERGLEHARGQIVAIFDADFVPAPDFLRRLVPWFEPDVGMVQARWGHLDLRASWLTWAQATLLDGHFVVEHRARAGAGLWFNFNGTAGAWRRQAIAQAGGWQHDTLTEDLDLSYRAQMAGWRFVYLDDLVVPAELPGTLAAFKGQQNRWARGGVQVARKLLGRIWQADVPLGQKVEATFHLTQNLAYPVATLLAALLPLAVWARSTGEAPVLLAIDVLLFLAATLSHFAVYGVAIVHTGGADERARMLRLPVAMALGLGMAISQSRAVFQGLSREVGTFVRTPKGGGAAAPYRARGQGVLMLEVGMAAWQWAGIAWAVSTGWLAALPFMALFAGGYTAVAVTGLREGARAGGREGQRAGRAAPGPR